MTLRTCGGCTLCCYLVPTQEIDSPANTHCQHECSKGCAIYADRPMSCKMWSCLWLTGENVGNRPDRSGYVVDMMPDFVTARDDTTGTDIKVPCHQVWVDPARPDAHKAPALRRWVEEQGRKNVATLIRFGNEAGLLLVPPTMPSNSEGVWIEKWSNQRPSRANKIAEIQRVLADNGLRTEITIDLEKTRGTITLRS